jgi:hypothetical protein
MLRKQKIKKMQIINKKIKMADGSEISIETGKLAKQAHGSVEIRQGNTVVLATGVSDFAFAIGQMFVTGDMGGFGIEILSSVADFLKSLGSQMVQFGMMSVLFGKLQLALMLGDPVSKIAAGLALIGVGVAMSIAAGAISAGIKKGQDKKKAKPFAKGGIVSSPTNALIGEYPGARRNPEVVAPLDKLKSLIGDSGSGGGMFTGQLETRVSGNDLVILMNRANKNRNGYY